MTLGKFSADAKLRIFAAIEAGLPPPEGEWDDAVFKEARDKGKPQMGATRYQTDAVVFEFIYPDPNGAPLLFKVKIAPPERIVYMAVPSWVVESVWQGEVLGSFHFESDAVRLVGEYRAGLEAGPNEKAFGAEPTVGRR
jgi:hypothetical protein